MTPETYGLMNAAAQKFLAEVSTDILDALRQGPATVSQIHERLNGNRTRKQIIEALGLLVHKSRLVGQESRTGCGELEVPYFLLTGAEPTPRPEPQAPSAESEAVPISLEESCAAE